MPDPFVGTDALVDEPRDMADDQGDQINSTQHTFAPNGRALLTYPDSRRMRLSEP